MHHLNHLKDQVSRFIPKEVQQLFSGGPGHFRKEDEEGREMVGSDEIERQHARDEAELEWRNNKKQKSIERMHIPPRGPAPPLEPRIKTLDQMKDDPRAIFYAARPMPKRASTATTTTGQAQKHYAKMPSSSVFKRKQTKEEAERRQELEKRWKDMPEGDAYRVKMEGWARDPDFVLLGAVRSWSGEDSESEGEDYSLHVERLRELGEAAQRKQTMGVDKGKAKQQLKSPQRTVEGRAPKHDNDPATAAGKRPDSASPPSDYELQEKLNERIEYMRPGWAAGTHDSGDDVTMTAKQKIEWYREHNTRVVSWHERKKSRSGKTPRWRKELVRKGKSYARRGMPDGYYDTSSPLSSTATTSSNEVFVDARSRVIGYKVASKANVDGKVKGIQATAGDQMRRTSRHNGADSDDSDVWNEILRRWTPTKATEDDSPVPIDGLKADEDRANKMAGETLEQDAQVARAQKNREVVRFSPKWKSPKDGRQENRPADLLQNSAVNRL